MSIHKNPNIIKIHEHHFIRKTRKNMKHQNPTLRIESLDVGFRSPVKSLALDGAQCKNALMN